MKSILINRNITLLLGGQFISRIGDRFHMLALAFWVLQTTHSPASMGVVLFASMLPSVLLGFVSGSIVDRYNRKMILIVADIFRGVAVICITAAWYFGTINLAMIIVTQILLSCASAFFDPAVSAVIPQLVEKERLGQANAQNQLLGGIANIIGPVLGGAAVAWAGYSFVFIFNAASFFIASVFTFCISYHPAQDSKNTVEATGKKEPLLKCICDGYKYIFNRRRVLVITVIIAINHFFVGAVSVVIPVLSNSLAGNGAQNMGFIEACFGIGIVATALVMQIISFNGREEKLMFSGVAGIGVVFVIIFALGMAGMTNVIAYFLPFMLLSMAIIVGATSYQVILQKNVDQHVSGRVFAVHGSVANLSIPLATLVFGFLLMYISQPLIMLGCGVAVIVVNVLLLCIYRK